MVTVILWGLAGLAGVVGCAVVTVVLVLWRRRRRSINQPSYPPHEFSPAQRRWAHTRKADTDPDATDLLPRTNERP
ncbi:hypothetical protein MOQ72_36240 [Saccharopolyspora sp. K220]|uniref:hypothetical protein n=1 Tax=Saccharopolyspora soli TaxID=2926618 RepID=UPI001F598A1A|nr:hypothetical protein [Saccharopolyspora soli]MCI2422889.1 hypothetical protein [Saccharopolyspora soli]